MITPETRIKRVLKRMDGFRVVSKQEFGACLPDEKLWEHETPIGLYEDPFSNRRNALFFTDKRLFLLDKENRQVRLADVVGVQGSKEKEEAADLVLLLKGGATMTFRVNYGDSKFRPVFQFQRLFQCLINDRKVSESN